jgi:RNase P/RNase MRP subunit p29
MSKTQLTKILSFKSFSLPLKSDLLIFKTKKMTNRFFFTLLILCVALTTWSQDQIVKTDGTILNGKVISFQNNKLVLQQSDETEITLPRKAISEIRLDAMDKKNVTVSAKSVETVKPETPVASVKSPATYAIAPPPAPVAVAQADVPKSYNTTPRSVEMKSAAMSPGEITSGLENRIITQSLALKEKVVGAGKVAIAVCVNAQGDVTTAKFKAVGSSTIDADLINVAVQNAKSFKFDKGQGEDCGIITYRFNMD